MADSSGKDIALLCGRDFTEQDLLLGSKRNRAPISSALSDRVSAHCLWNEYVERYHYLGYKRSFGAHQRYFILSHNEQLLGCILFAASVWALEVRDQWIGWTKTDRSKRLNLVVNNNRIYI